MKKFTIQNMTINLNNDKEKNIISFLEDKDEKYILYSENNINENNIDNNIFIKFQFNQNINILPKKKLSDMNLKIINNDNLYSLSWNNNPVYYLKNSKNIKISDINLKPILSNGLLLYNKPKELGVNLDTRKNETNIVNDILQKKNNIDNCDSIKSINFSPPIINNNINIKKETEENNILLNSNESENIVENSVASNESKNIIENNVASNESENIVENNLASNESENIVENIVASNESENIIENSVASNESENIVENSVASNESENIIENNVGPQFNSKENLEKIVDISNMINKEKIDLDNKRNEIENNVFNLENLLVDFNKLFNSVNENNLNSNIQNDNKIIINNKSIDNSSSNNIKVTNTNKINNEFKNNSSSNNIKVTNTNKINNLSSNNIKVINNNIIKNNNSELNIDNTNKEYITKINYFNVIYRLNTIKLEQTNELNFLNLYKTNIVKNNIINKLNLSFALDSTNSSYLIMFFNQKYLINKVNNSIILTNLINKKTQLIKNKENFKLGLHDYMLYNESTLFIPMINKKIYDNKYGTSFNMYIPKN